MVDFVGRTVELGLLRHRLNRVSRTGTGIALALRGRRQVGKSRLVQEFCDRAEAPYVFFTAVKGASTVELLQEFLGALRDSALPNAAELLPEQAPRGWPDMFRVMASVLPDRPSVVVLDELPWLAEQDDTFDGALQAAWDRLLRDRPILLLLLGSDVHMMERLTSYDRPFYGRADNLVLGPLNPAETGQALGLDAVDALDAHLLCGGLPGILTRWPYGTPALEFAESECDDPAAPMFSVAESTLMAEFPTPDRTRAILEAVGGGDRTYTNIASTAGGNSEVLPSGVLSPLLRRLVEDKQVLAVDHPLSTKPGKPALYRVADSNLRCYLAMLRTAHELVRRGRKEAAVRLIRRRWDSWRGRAVEPLVREALALAALAGDLPWEDVEAVGGWWNRKFDPEVDVVGGDHAPVARHIRFTGSIKWLESAFDHHDLSRLDRSLAQVPGVDPDRTGRVVVSRSGLAPGLGLGSDDLVWGPEDVVAAWR
ncbi:AAA family ATPase [Salinactinospora qingdaonensis]|uniref:ATP-binding protein n=1 Tax=Salinactinospora qingdaonensis TaxID=702744 RepID=A0ABP7FVX7_9ACTN